MAFALSILAVAFAAFCLWLTVRIVSRRERWAKCTVALLIVLAAYPLSMGPWIALYIGAHRHQKNFVVPFEIYRPIAFVAHNSPAKDVFGQYVHWWFEAGLDLPKWPSQ
ncbi:MAG TPA: hypothetical protein VGH74_04830 [Planctomycetaceae bacterium]|jgi:hypothetical protein